MRHRKGLLGWPSEDLYCNSRRAISFPFEESRGVPGCYWQPVSMRLYSDGSAMTKLELGFKPQRSSFNLGSLVSDLLNIQVRVRACGTRGTRELVRLSQCGSAVSSLYEYSTTKIDRRFSQGERSVFNETPCVFVAAEVGKADSPSPNRIRAIYSIPNKSTLISFTGIFEGTHLFQWDSKSGIDQIRTFVMIANEGPPGSMTRRANRLLRLYILRLNAESSILRRVLVSMMTGNLKPDARSDDSIRLREYLHDTIQKMERSRQQLADLAKVELEAADAARGVFEGEISSLRTQIERLRQRPIVQQEFIPRPASNAESKGLTTAIAEYDEILGIIRNMGRVMEQSPRAFEKMGEEDLRTHFLVQLNGQYGGRATGETFNYQGKTDILIREEGKNIFVAECKFWGGERQFHETIDQLLSYLSWRDTKAAVLIFSRNQNFSEVLHKLEESAPLHTSFQRFVGKLDESSFQYVFHQPADKNREVILSVLAFNVPRPEPKA